MEHLSSSFPPARMTENRRSSEGGRKDASPWDICLSYPPMGAVTSLLPEEHKPEAEHRRLLGQWDWDKMTFRTPLAMFRAQDRFGTSRSGFTSQIGSEAS